MREPKGDKGNEPFQDDSVDGNGYVMAFDGAIARDAPALYAFVERPDSECNVYTATESFLVPVDSYLDVLPERCTAYEVALFVTDADGNPSAPVFTTVSGRGQPCA